MAIKISGEFLSPPERVFDKRKSGWVIQAGVEFLRPGLDDSGQVHASNLVPDQLTQPARQRHTPRQIHTLGETDGDIEPYYHIKLQRTCGDTKITVVVPIRDNFPVGDAELNNSFSK